jgi:hypothetical protein
LLGIERDTFLLLSGYLALENTDNKTRNVWAKYFSYIIFSYFKFNIFAGAVWYVLIYLDDRDMFKEFRLD